MVASGLETTTRFRAESLGIEAIRLAGPYGAALAREGAVPVPLRTIRSPLFRSSVPSITPSNADVSWSRTTV